MKTKHILLSAVLGGTAVIAAVVAARAGRPTRESPPVPGATSQPDGPAVATLIIRSQSLEETIIATGTVRADESVEIRAEVSGKLMRINFQEGAAVKAGELLAAINDAELRATLQRAVHRKELAELKTRRLSTLLARGGVTQQDYDISASELNVLIAEVAVIEAQLAHMEIRAPFDGVVGLRAVSVGAFVTPSTRIATFQRLDRLKVDFSIPEKYARRLGPENEVLITAGDGGTLAGRIHAIEPLVDAATRTVQVRAICSNPSGRLLAGGFVSVKIGLVAVPDAILVPSMALVPGASDQSVLIVENGLAKRRLVRTGTRTEAAVQITEGLHPGEVVIVSGQQQLRPGQAVRVTADQPRLPAAAAPPSAAAAN